MIVDANVLIYAINRDSRFHESATDWLEGALRGSVRIGFPWVSLTAFQRIVTHSRAFPRPVAPERAWTFVTEWLSADQSWVPVAGDRHADVLGQLIVDNDLRGNLVTDAHLAALAIEHGVGVCSYDSDFARFPGLRWHNPAMH